MGDTQQTQAFPSKGSVIQAADLLCYARVNQ
jgi:hypothetical protein